MLYVYIGRWVLYLLITIFTKIEEKEKEQEKKRKVKNDCGLHTP